MLNLSTLVCLWAFRNAISDEFVMWKTRRGIAWQERKKDNRNKFLVYLRWCDFIETTLFFMNWLVLRMIYCLMTFKIRPKQVFLRNAGSGKLISKEGGAIVWDWPYCRGICQFNVTSYNWCILNSVCEMTLMSNSYNEYNVRNSCWLPTNYSHNLFGYVDSSLSYVWNFNIFFSRFFLKFKYLECI